MPDIDGYDLCQKIRTCYPEIPCIAMSGHVYAQDTDNAQFDGFLRKPFDIDGLIQVTELALQSQTA